MYTRLACTATFLRDRSRVTDRSIGSRMGHSVTAVSGVEGGVGVFIYHRGRRLKGVTKSTCRPPCATKNLSSLYRLQDRHQRLVSSSFSHSLSQLPFRSPFSPAYHGRTSPTLLFYRYETSLPLLSARISRHRIPSLNGGAKVNGTPGEKADRRAGRLRSFDAGRS